jgi:hypothetical protein
MRLLLPALIAALLAEGCATTCEQRAADQYHLCLQPFAYQDQSGLHGTPMPALGSDAQSCRMTYQQALGQCTAAANPPAPAPAPTPALDAGGS